MLNRILGLFAVLLAASPLLASDPPAAFESEPPSAKFAEPEYDAKKACVKVETAVPGRGFQFAGGGTCVWSGEGESIVLTNNHIFSEQHHPQGGFRDDVYPQKATVAAGGKSYKATAVAADRSADICVVVVEGRIAAAPIASELPAPGDVVWRSGMGSGFQKCRVVTAEASADSMGFNVVGKSESGDSGSGYFNERDELVAVHCGKNTVNQPRGTPVTVAKTVVKTRTPLLFPRLRERIAGRSVVEPPAAKVSPKKADPPKAAPKAAPKQVLWRMPDGTLAYYPEGVTPAAAGGCPGGNCPLPQSRSRGVFRR